MLRTVCFGPTSVVVRMWISSTAPVSPAMIFAEITPGNVESNSSARRIGSTLPAIGEGERGDELAGRVTDDSSCDMVGTLLRRRGSAATVLRTAGRQAGGHARRRKPQSNIGLADVVVKRQFVCIGRSEGVVPKLPVQRALPDPQQVGRLPAIAARLL